MKSPKEKKQRTELLEIYNKTEFALSMAKNLKEEEAYYHSFWYHAIGILNAFYALREELTKKTKNVKDNILTNSINCWLDKNSNKLNSFFGNARNKATHHGKVSISWRQEREEDRTFDRGVLIDHYFITIHDSNIKNMPYEKFMDSGIQAFEHFKQGIIDIYTDYIDNNGTNQAPIVTLSDCDEDLSHLL